MSDPLDRKVLEARLQQLAAMPTVPEFPDDIIRPTDKALAMTRVVAESLLASAYCKLRCLHISAGYDGHVLFSLDGTDRRDIDLWIHDTDEPGHDGEAHWVADDAAGQYEGYLPYHRCGELLPWLFGEGPLPLP